jgi:RNA polymerase sigma factor (sigma-70 family)
MRRGDAGARERLILSQVPWVMYLARRLWKPHHELDDLISVGLVALCRAVDKYDARLSKLTEFCRRPITWDIGNYQRADTTVTRPARRNVKHGARWDAAKRCGTLVSDGICQALVDGGCDEVEAAEIAVKLRRVVAALNQRLSLIVEMRLAGCTLEEVGRRCHLTRQRVCQLEQAAHVSIRKAMGDE